MSKIKIAHSADWHISIEGENKVRYIETEFVIDKFVDDCIEQKVNVVVLAGDQYDRAKANDDEKLILSNALNRLAAAGIHVILVPGNHDLTKKNYGYDPGNGSIQQIVDPIELVVVAMNNPLIHYIQKSGFYKCEIKDSDNALQSIIFANWSHKTFYSNFEEPYNPWEHEKAQYVIDELMKTTPVFDLYHNPVYDCIDWTGSVVKGNNESRMHPTEFKGHLAMLGDIHIPCVVQTSETKSWTYPSSLMSCNFGEGNYYKNFDLDSRRANRHGFNIIDFDTTTMQYSIVWQESYRFHAHHTIDLYDINQEIINKFELQDAGKNANSVKIRLHFTDLDKSELLGQFVEKLKTKYPIRYCFMERAKLQQLATSDDLDNKTLKSIFDKDWLRAQCMQLANDQSVLLISEPELRASTIVLFEEYLDKALSTITISNSVLRTKILSLEMTNFMSFEKCVIDFETLTKNGDLIQILGPNGVGKTTILKALAWCGTDKYTANQVANRREWLINLFNDKLPECDEASVATKFEYDGEVYLATRTLRKQWAKNSLKDITNWKSEVRKIEQIFDLECISTPKSLSDEDKTRILYNSFGWYEQFIELNSINSVTLTSIINSNPEELVRFVLQQVGADFIIQLCDTRHWVKKDMLDSLSKPKTELHILLQQIAEAKLEIESITQENQENAQQKEILQDKSKKLIQKISTLEALVPKLEPSLENVTIESIDTLLTNLAERKLQLEFTNTDLTKLIESSEATNNTIDESIDVKQKEIDENAKALSDKILLKDELNKNIDAEKEKISKVISDNVSLLNKTLQEKQKDNSATAMLVSTNKSNIQSELSHYVIDFNKAIDAKINAITEIINAKNADITKLNTVKTALETENSLSDKNVVAWSKILDTPECPTCKQSMTSAEALRNSIAQANISIKTNLEKIERLSEAVVKIEADISAQERIKTQETANKLTSVLTIPESDSQYGVFKKLQEDIVEFEKTIETNNKTITILETTIKEIEQQKAEHKLIKPKVDELQKALDALLLQQKEIDLTVIQQQNTELRNAQEALKSTKIDVSAIRTTIANNNTKIAVDASTKITLESSKTKIEEYNKSLETHKTLAKDIEELKVEEISLTDKITLIETKINEHFVKLGKLKEQIVKLEEDSENAKKYAIANLAFTLYRIVIGETLLQNQVFDSLSPVLNHDLQELLKDVNFEIGFDKDSRQLVFIDKVGQVNTRPVCMISGMEETMSALSLIAVIKSRKVNQFIDVTLIDEITGKLNDSKELTSNEHDIEIMKNYKDLFTKLLKNFVDVSKSKVFVIDHVLNSDVFDSKIEITKNNKGIARLIA